ncbi:hypothetical protein [Streptomyces sp. T028]|uniref:hypothetical protein n=1 Tax=Streptomyces sp. T028 TaxID=3394379 RepID=UPI003A88B655
MTRRSRSGSALEEHFTTQSFREANADDPLGALYRLLAERGHTTAGNWDRLVAGIRRG